MTDNDNVTFRNTLAQRIRHLRTNKILWRPGAPRADLSCRRPFEDAEVASTFGDTSLAQLIDVANRAGVSDFNTVFVRESSQPDPYEDWSHTVLSLYQSKKMSDEQYFFHVDVLWQEYQSNLLGTQKEKEDYQLYLRLKQIFEPT
ncbi:MAG: hypothetical protein Q7S87_05230 [Agitococcus sp.]|nr:hypothetical protein [Agitococcus sp.]MDO9179192.1 hypothetical protein [Agitococcus sp.]